MRSAASIAKGTSTPPSQLVYSNPPMSLALLVGAAVAGGTYLYSKKKKASTGQSVAVGAATGTAAGAATALTLFVLPVVYARLGGDPTSARADPSARARRGTPLIAAR